MGYVYAVTNGLTAICLLSCCYARANRRFRGTLLSPFTVLLVFHVIASLDFIELFSAVSHRNTFRQLGQYFISSKEAVLEAWGLFTWFSNALLLGALLALAFAKNRRSNQVVESDLNVDVRGQRLAWMFLLVAYGAIGAVAFQIFSNGFIAITGARQTFFRDHQLIFIGCAFQIPSLILLFSVRRVREPRMWAFLLLNIALIFFTGSRGSIFFILLVFVVRASFEGITARLRWLLWATPLIVVTLVVARFYTRESKTDSVVAFVNENDGVAQLFFGGSEIATAEVLTLLSQQTELRTTPFSSAVGLATFPIPRGVFTEKPLGASAYFTSRIAPERWELTSSEIITSGYGDVYMQFGAVWAVFALMFIGFAWTYTTLRVISGTSVAICVWMPPLVWWMYVFLRADIYNIGQTLWPTSMVYGGYFVVRWFTGRAPRSIPVGAERR